MELASRIFGRLSEVEKISLRSAAPARLEYLADTSHRSDLPSVSFEERCAVMEEVHALCVLEYATKGQDPGFSGVTWKY